MAISGFLTTICFMSIRTAIGIDLGTTYSCAAYFKNDKVDVIINQLGNRITPSYVAFTDEERLVGDAAYYQASLNPKNTIFGAKRLIGRHFNDEVVQSDIKLLPYRVVNKDNRPYIEVDVFGDLKLFSPQEIASMILLKLKEAAENALDRTVTDAVITVPAYFNDSQRQATKDAAAIAKLNVLSIINEPTAAALTYGLNKLNDVVDNDFMQKRKKSFPSIITLLQGSEARGRNILVYDLGGGTFDVSVLNIKDGVFTVKATDGNTHLGGEDFDNMLLQHFTREFEKKTAKIISSNENALAKLKKHSEIVKRTLTTNTSARIHVESLVAGKDFSSSITRARFDSLCSDLFKSTLCTVENVIRESGLEKQGIDEIILVGGSTRIPRIQSLIFEFFGGKSPNKSVNPEEAVAYGAAIKAAMLMNDPTSTITNDISLKDVNSLSLGIETLGGVMSVIIPRNTILPTTVSNTYLSTMENQPMMTMPVYEGERTIAKDNHLLGEFVLNNVTMAKKGKAKVIVTMSLDLNGMLTVTAVDKANGANESLTIKNESNRLTKEEIDQMIHESEIYKQRDQEELKRLWARDDLESYLYKVRAAFRDHCEKLSLSDRDLVDREISDMSMWLETSRSASIEEYQDNHNWFKQQVHPIMSSYLKGY
ncbi:chaperone [Scheffersomyces coipomensis]|uniref:chaperone n=1 Tax=Scheffersomyces coipomensis TaxID=1788519 RepID=UPI00315D3B26